MGGGGGAIGGTRIGGHGGCMHHSRVVGEAAAGTSEREESVEGMKVTR